MQLIEPEVVEKKQYETRLIPTPESFGPAITTGVESAVPYLADDGFNGQRWIDHWSDMYGVEVIAAPPKNARNAWNQKEKKWLSHYRQIVETTIARLCETFGLKRLNAHSDWGKIARLATMMAAYNLGILLNRRLGRTDGSLATLIQ